MGACQARASCDGVGGLALVLGSSFARETVLQLATRSELDGPGNLSPAAQPSDQRLYRLAPEARSMSRGKVAVPHRGFLAPKGDMP